MVALFNIASALLGAFAISIFIIKQTKKCSYDHAIWFIKESIIDIIYNRSENWLHLSDFPLLIKNDLMCLFSDVTKKQWENILRLNSKVTEWADTSEGIVFYKFVMPWNEEYINTYRNMISNLCRLSLINMHCSITDVVIDFIEWDIPDYRICCIKYARTVTEQESFKNMQETTENNVIGINLNEIHDEDLDNELSEYEGVKDVTN